MDTSASNFDSTAGCDDPTLCVYPPVNDLFAGAIEIMCGDSIEDNNSTATDTDEPGTGGAGMWYFFTGNGDELTLDLCSDVTTFDTKLGVYTGMSADALTEVVFNDDACGLQSSVTFLTTAGETYYVYVNSYGSSTGDFELVATCVTTVAMLQLEITALLGGPLNEDTYQMNDNIRTVESFPLTEPYTELGFEHIIGGGEQTTAEVLAVEGFDAIVDWVIVELRNGDNPEERIVSQAALIQKDGDIVSTDGVSPVMFTNPGGSVLVVIRHRNHLGVCNLDPTVLSDGDEVISLDFTDPALPVMGGEYAMGVVGNVRVLYAGDANSDGAVNPFDKNSHWRVENGGAFDYFESKSDFNLDGAINPFDKNAIWRVNNGKSEQID